MIHSITDGGASMPDGYDAYHIATGCGSVIVNTWEAWRRYIVDHTHATSEEEHLVANFLAAKMSSRDPPIDDLCITLKGESDCILSSIRNAFAHQQFTLIKGPAHPTAKIYTVFVWSGARSGAADWVGWFNMDSLQELAIRITVWNKTVFTDPSSLNLSSVAGACERREVNRKAKKESEELRKKGKGSKQKTEQKQKLRSTKGAERVKAQDKLVH